jgi:hypothetical protein
MASELFFCVDKALEASPDTKFLLTCSYLEIYNEARHDLLLTPCYSPLTTHHSPLTTHHSPLTTHHSPFTTHRSPLLTAHRSPLTAHR